MGIINSWKLNKLEAHVFPLEELEGKWDGERELLQQGGCTQKEAKSNNNPMRNERNSHV